MKSAPNGFILTDEVVLGIYGELASIALAVKDIPESKETLIIKGSCKRILDALKPEKEKEQKENDV